MRAGAEGEPRATRSWAARIDTAELDRTAAKETGGRYMATTSQSGSKVSAPTESQGLMANQLEVHHIDVIPASERHGKPRDQIPVWLAANTTVVNFVLGGLMVVLGLNLFWAIIAVLIGNILGAVLTGFHAMQGPRLGVPQMIQSRGQFGFVGAEFIFLASILLDVGYMAASQALQAKSMNLLVPGVAVTWWIIIVTVPALVVAIFGYRWIHQFAKVITLVLVAVIFVVFIQAALYGHGISPAASGFKLSSGPVFLAGIAIMFMNMLSWAPYISDYSRYLPEKVSFRSTFWSIFAGLMISTTLFAALGAWVTAMVPKAATTPLTALAAMSGTWIMCFMWFGQIPGVTMNGYSGMLASANFGSSVQRMMEGRYRQVVRIAGILIMFAIGTILAELGWRTFLHTFEQFLTVLIFLFVPWSAINLVDFYLLRHGSYDVRSFFVRKGSYADFMLPACIVYLITLGIEFPFMNTTLYVGPISKAMTGVNIDWIVGFVVAGVLYYFAAKLGRSKEHPLEAGISATTS